MSPNSAVSASKPASDHVVVSSRIGMERTARPGRSALSSGALTALSTAVMTGTAAIGGAILAREFGHGVKTDGFFAAYGLYLALVLVAQTLRVVVLPPLTRAREEGRLEQEVGAWAVALSPAVPTPGTRPPTCSRGSPAARRARSTRRCWRARSPPSTTTRSRRPA